MSSHPSSDSLGDSLEIKGIGTFQSQGKRAVQEDFMLTQREKRIFIVADGFGGPATQPAKNVSEAIQSFLFKEAGDLDATLPFVLRTYFSLAGNVLFNALIYANQKLRRLNKEKTVHEKGGASVVAGFLDGHLLAVASVGDCQAWLFRGGQAVELIIPRSYNRMLNPVDRTSKTSKSEQNVPMMAIGMSEDLEPEIVEYKIQQGDWVAFATDGISFEIQHKIQEIKLKNFNVSDSIKSFHQSLDSGVYVDNAAISLIIF